MDKSQIENYNTNTQPVMRGGPTAGIPKYFNGGQRSIARLKNLNFDPIGELVDKYRKLEQEIEYQEKLRSNEIVELNAHGKPRSYRAEQHYALYDKLISIGEKLVRYKYGRVPESDTELPNKVAPLVINLTKKGETYVVNEDQPDRTDENDAEDF